MALTVRQIGQVAPPLKQKVDQFQQVIDSNDQTIERIKEKLATITPYREKLSTSVQQRQDDRRDFLAALARLEDALAAFTNDSSELETVIEELPRLLERISLPAVQPQGGGPGQMAVVDGMYNNARRMPVVAIDLPLPYFESLTRRFEARAIQVNERVRSIEGALATYSQKASGVSVSGQIESVIRSEYAQFRALATQLMEAANRLDQLRELAIRTKSVPAGMLVTASDHDTSTALAPQNNITNSNLLTGTTLANQGGALFAPQMAQAGGMFNQNMGGGGMFAQNSGGGAMFGQNMGGGGMFGQSSGGGMFGQNPGGGMGGGLFGQNSGGGMFGQNSGGGLFGQNTGGGMFGQNTGGGMFGQNSGGGMFGQNTGGGMFGQNTGGGMFGQNIGGGGLFGGQNSGGGMFGQNSGGGGLFGGQKTGGGMFGQNTGGGMFGQNTGGGLFGGGGF